jgi:mono/diheme cytochrome c family protein
MPHFVKSKRRCRFRLVRPLLSLCGCCLFTLPLHAADPIEHGAKLARQKCDACHTLRDDKGQPAIGLYAGGKVIGSAAASNLTPDPSGISYYDGKLFLQAVRTGQVGARKLKPIMNPATFRSLSDDDLRDVFAYLKTIPPVKHRVDNTEEATQCRVCRQKHGAGEKN